MFRQQDTRAALSPVVDGGRNWHKPKGVVRLLPNSVALGLSKRGTALCEQTRNRKIKVRTNEQAGRERARPCGADPYKKPSNNKVNWSHANNCPDPEPPPSPFPSTSPPHPPQRTCERKEVAP